MYATKIKFSSLVCILCLGFQVTTLFAKSGFEEGCTGPTVLPNQPFTVVWNVPSGGCGAALNFSHYGIVTNKNDKFSGDEMTLFYGLGKFPYIAGKSIVNGGVPQLGNLTLHLLKTVKDVETFLPDVKFGGLGVVDYEGWRPIFDTNYDSLAKYQVMSIDLVKQLHPTWTNKTRIREEAEAEFELGARYFLQSTLQVVNKLRPDGHWGFYGYPECRFGVNPKTNICNNDHAENDKLSWLWKSSTGLYPRIYTSVVASLSSRTAGVEHVVNETMRMKARYTSPSILIMPYTLVQTGGTYFFNEGDLDVAIKIAGDMGSSGVTVWGSSSQFHEHGECQLLQAYLDTVLGPYVLKLTNFYSSCSQKKCSGHGRCINQKYELVYQKYLAQYGRPHCRRDSEEIEQMQRKVEYGDEKKKRFDMESYVCSCYTGWKGPKCDQK